MSTVVEASPVGCSSPKVEFADRLPRVSTLSSPALTVVPAGSLPRAFVSSVRDCVCMCHQVYRLRTNVRLDVVGPQPSPMPFVLDGKASCEQHHPLREREDLLLFGCSSLSVSLSARRFLSCPSSGTPRPSVLEVSP